MIATAEICDRLEAIVDLGVPNFALTEYPAPENYPRGGLSAVPGRHARHELLTGDATAGARVGHR